MDTGPDERLPYRELARQGARVQRSLPASALTRLQAVAPGQGRLQVEVSFALDEEQRPWVRGSAEVAVRATCQRCLEPFEHPMRVEFELCIVTDPQLASALAESADVLTAAGEAVTVADIVEDELLLDLPDRLCAAEPCPHAPALSFPAEAAPQGADNPFHVLAELKR